MSAYPTVLVQDEKIPRITIASASLSIISPVLNMPQVIDMWLTAGVSHGLPKLCAFKDTWMPQIANQAASSETGGWLQYLLPQVRGLPQSRVRFLHTPPRSDLEMKKVCMQSALLHKLTFQSNTKVPEVTCKLMLPFGGAGGGGWSSVHLHIVCICQIIGQSV